jgi:hypothetical protein
MVDGGGQLIYQWLLTATPDVTIVLVLPDDRSVYKVSGEVARCVLQEAEIVGTPTWTVKKATGTKPGEGPLNFITFVLASPRVRRTGHPPYGPEWASLRATSLFQRSATA